jgi:hypothetical protein
MSVVHDFPSSCARPDPELLMALRAAGCPVQRSPSGSGEAEPAPIDGSFATAYHAEPLLTGGALSGRTATAAPGCPRRTFSHSGRTANPTSNTLRTTAEPAHAQSGNGSSLQVPFRSPHSSELMSNHGCDRAPNARVAGSPARAAWSTHSPTSATGLTVRPDPGRSSPATGTAPGSTPATSAAPGRAPVQRLLEHLSTWGLT